MLPWEYLVHDMYVGKDTLPTDWDTETELGYHGGDGWELVSANWEHVDIVVSEQVSYRDRAYRTIWKRQKEDRNGYAI